MIKADNENVSVHGESSKILCEFSEIVSVLKQLGFDKEDLEYGIKIGFMTEEECKQEAKKVIAEEFIETIKSMILLKALEDDLK